MSGRSPERERRVRRARGRHVAARQQRRRQARTLRARWAQWHRRHRAAEARWRELLPVWTGHPVPAIRQRMAYDSVHERVQQMLEDCAPARPAPWAARGYQHWALFGPLAQTGSAIVRPTYRGRWTVRLEPPPSARVSAAEARITAAVLAEALVQAFGGTARAAAPTREDVVTVLATGPRVLREWLVRALGRSIGCAPAPGSR